MCGKCLIQDFAVVLVNRRLDLANREGWLILVVDAYEAEKREVNMVAAVLKCNGNATVLGRTHRRRQEADDILSQLNMFTSSI